MCYYNDIIIPLRHRNRQRPLCNTYACILYAKTMADSEFEEFRQIFESLPQHLRASAQTYTLVHDVLSDEESSTEATINKNFDTNNAFNVFSISDDDQNEPKNNHIVRLRHEKRRRKLPELPKNKTGSVLSLADELGEVFSPDRRKSFVSGLRDSECRSPDSGISLVHSPERAKSSSPQQIDTPTPASSCSSGLPLSQLELLEATHRGLYKFVPRHRDEMEVDIGDPIYVQKEAEDCWCEGVNLRTGAQGAFPSAYAVDVEYTDFDSATPKVKRERFLLGYMGSVETMWHKGNSVLCQAIRKITERPNCKPQSCILEVSDQGLRMVDRAKSSTMQTRDSSTPCQDYFYSLKNVSFCAFYPDDNRYMGFVTKHPTCQRFACHVFKANESSRPVAEAIGRAFQRFYQKYIETAYPVEDIYIE
ncbi:JNK-interacting protein 1 isoform X1 [Metopolophium dirhodum]|uniref:JNK-interacting protein 1 isoform X1 n=1 Tax=Metopolophium dirhodum TaxID=44670 RepID=UPI00298F5068|nr:JNK-interacting protein 1 isoform X1 [Metopolophium dirhodum]